MSRAVITHPSGRGRTAAPTAPPAAVPAAPPLSRLLVQAARVLQAVQQGRSTADALAPCPAALRPGVQALSFHALRQLGRAQALRTLLVAKRPPAAVDNLLLLGLSLMLDDGVQAPAYAPHTVVDQTVHAARQTTPHASGMVNAVLRRYLRERDALLMRVMADPVACWNHPAWWIERLKLDWPMQWQAILEQNNQRPPMVLRTHAARTTPQDYVRRLRDDLGLSAHVIGPQALALAQPVPVDQLPGFAQGDVSVQDAAAQQAAPLLLGALPRSATPWRVLDACAAPGGKTAHLLEWAQAHAQALMLSAVDVDEARTRRIHETLARTGAQAKVLVADAGQPHTWWDGQAFDGILLDAPCTASGIVRRHPDIRWLRRAADIDALARVQGALLSALWPLLKPGGALLYATCSVFRAEGETQMERFVASHPDAVALPAPGHLLPRGLAPGAHAEPLATQTDTPADHDGFFYGLLRKAGNGAHDAAT